jgi:hypothetical protein
MKTKLSREQMFKLYGTVKNFMEKNNTDFDKRFVYALYRNLDVLKGEVNSYLESEKPDKEYDEYQQLRRNILVKYSDKDESGNAIEIKLNNNMSQIQITNPDNKNNAVLEIENLNNKYKDVIEKRRKEIEQLDELMKEDIEIDVCKVSFKYFPDQCNVLDHDGLRFLIKETNEEIDQFLLV